MPRLISALFCQKTIRDAETNSISIIDIIENVQVKGPSFPETFRLPIHAEVYTLWMRSENQTSEKNRCRIFLCDPHGVSKRKVELTINLVDNCYCRNIFRISSVEFRGEGIYEFHIEINEGEAEEGWKLIGTIPFEVNFITDESTLENAKLEPLEK